ncbi:MAG TPA: CU044_5270 family protein [Actinomadura sp.]|jgi:hypothetical protein|nr:CU044_5270 family protein [Actinomadura sp.]
MNVVEKLAAARPAHLDPAVETDQATRSVELARAMAAPRTPRTARKADEIRSNEMKRRIVRPLWGLGVVGAAAVTAVALAVAGSGGSGAPGSPGISASAAPTTMDARTVLLAAAHQASGQPDRTAKYWHSAQLHRDYHRADGYTVVSESRDERWTPSTPGDESWGRQQNLGTRPVSPADEVAWRAAGSPATFPVGALVRPRAEAMKRLMAKRFTAKTKRLMAKRLMPGRLTLTMTTKPGEVQTSHSAQVEGDKIFWLGRNVSMKDLRALPTDPAGLKKSLLRSYEGHDTEASSVPMSSDAWLFRVTSGLIMDMPVSPKVRAAAFEMLAGLKTVKTVGMVKDAQGRAGTAIAVTEHTRSAGVQQQRLIIDEATGRALGQEIVVLRPAGTMAGLPPGSVVSSSTVVTDEWTDSGPR